VDFNSISEAILRYLNDNHSSPPISNFRQTNEVFVPRGPTGDLKRS
jgi:hypothetical protein